MSGKKVFLLLVTLVMTGLFINAVSAQTESFLPEIIEKWAKFLFLDLSGLLKSAPDTFIIYSKFLFFFLVFTAIFWGASKVFKENKNIAVTIAILFAIITVVMIPKSMMLFIFESYSVVISFIFGFLPFIVGFIIAHKAAGGDEKHKRILRGIIYIFIAAFTVAFVGTLRGFEDPLFVELGKWAEVAAFIALIFGIWNLFGSIGGGGKVKEGEKTGADGKKEEPTPSEKEGAKVSKGEIIEEKKILTDLRKLLNQIKAPGESNLSAANKVRIALPEIKRKMQNLWFLEQREMKLEEYTENQLKKLGILSKRNEYRSLIEKEKNLLIVLNTARKQLEDAANKRPPPQKEELIKHINTMIKIIDILIKVNSKEILGLE